MKVAVVTSCSAQGWLQYGERFVRTFREHWPREVTLHLVSEDALPDCGAGVKFWPLWASSSMAREFEKRHAHRPVACGREARAGQIGWKEKQRAAGYNFRYDVVRFAKKVFAIELVSRTLGGRLYWVDADVVSFAPVSLGLLAELLPAQAALSCLDRGSYHSECGFVGYNLEHAAARAFIEAFAATYASDDVFRLAEWHDSWVFDHERRRMHTPTHAIPHCSRRHPFVNSVLGLYMDHLKGRRKDLGRTPAHEMVAGYNLPYWRGAA